MDEIRIFGECECCDNTVTDEGGEYYVDSEGRVFCSIECACEVHRITKIEV